jgi:hypothetical protein
MFWSSSSWLMSLLTRHQTGIVGRMPRARRRKGQRAGASRRAVNCDCLVETLEGRLLLAATASTTFTLLSRGSHGTTPSATAGVAPIDPAQMQAAYGVNQISFGGTAGTGAGQTIAIVDAYNDPDIIANANSFSSEFGLPQFNGSGEPTLKVLNESGGTSLPSNASPGTWDVEEALDVEWAHSIAPDANIILFEANSASYSDLLKAVTTAADYTGVSVVSMSWSGSEFSGETSYDSDFLTPSGHQGVTFLAATGDTGTPSGYPAFSPNVVAVGGTSLDINSSGTYVSESAWDDEYGAGGGGISQVEAQPSYQVGKVNGTSSTQRTVPDVSMDADPETGVYVLDTDYTSGYLEVGGTSLATPMWAGLISIADQGRALNGESSLNGLTQTLPALYSLPSSDFHDITTGTNGTYAATPGYDLATGIGSPVANLLVPALADYGATPAPSVSGPASASLNENSTVVFSSSQGDAITLTDAEAGSNADTLTLSVADGTLTLGSTTGLTISSGANGTSAMTVTGTLANLNAALNGLVYTPKSGFSGGDSLHVSITDPGDSLTGSTAIALTVSAPTAPTIKVPPTVSVTENGTVVFSTAQGDAITFTDSYAGSNAETLVLTVSDGSLTLATTSGVTITNGSNGSSSMSVSGTLANLNAAVNGLTYTPAANFVGSDSLKISLTDSGDNLMGSASVGLSVTSPTQPPTVTDPGTASVNEDSTLTFSTSKDDAIDVADPDADGNVESLTLTTTHGTLKLASTTGLKTVSGSNRSASMTVSGTLANLNAALNGLVFTPTSRYTGTATVTISLKDSGDGLTGSGTVDVTVNKVGRAGEFRGQDAPVEAPRTPTQFVRLEPDSDGATVLFGNASSNGITISVGAPDAKTAPASSNAGSVPVSPTANPGTTQDELHDNATTKTSTSANESSNDTTVSAMDDVVQWLGLKAALEFLNR